MCSTLPPLSSTVTGPGVQAEVLRLSGLIVYGVPQEVNLADQRPVCLFQRGRDLNIVHGHKSGVVDLGYIGVNGHV